MPARCGPRHVCGRGCPVGLQASWHEGAGSRCPLPAATGDAIGTSTRAGFDRRPQVSASGRCDPADRRRPRVDAGDALSAPH